MNIDEKVINLVFKRWNVLEEKYTKYSNGKIGNIYVDTELKRCIKILESPLSGCNQEDIKNIVESKKEIIMNFLNKDYLVKIIKIDGKYYDIFVINNKVIISYFMEFIEASNINIIENDKINYKHLLGCIECIKKFHNDMSKINIDCKIDWQVDYKSVYSLCLDETLKEKMYEYYNCLISKKEDCIIHGDMNKRNILYCTTNDTYKIIDIDTIKKGWKSLDMAYFLFSIIYLDFSTNKILSKDKINEIISIISEEYSELQNNNFKEEVDFFMRYRRLMFYIIYIYKIKIKNTDDMKIIKKQILSEEKIII